MHALLAEEYSARTNLSNCFGSFGMCAETYEASVKIANLCLLPKLSETTPDTVIVASGFSCREQIEGLAHRETLHLAEVLARTLA